MQRFSFTPTPGPNEVELKVDLKGFSRKLPGGTLHKFGQGCSVEDIFRLPPKIIGFKFQPPKNNIIFGSKN